MEFILSYNNNEGVMVFPAINNGSVMLNRDQDNPTFDGMTGQLQALGNTNLASFTVEAIFPLHKYSWIQPGSWQDDGWRYVETINAVRLRKIPFRAIYLDDRGEEVFNMPVSVESFEYGLDRAKDIAFRLDCREYRFGKTPTVESLPKQASADGATVTVKTEPVKTEAQQAAETSNATMTMRSGAVVSSGRTITVPGTVAQTGMIPNYTYWRRTWNPGTNQRALYDIWTASGSPSSNSIATIKGYYLIACTTKFGMPGDAVMVYLEQGKTLKCIIGDSKGANPANAGEAGNVWGHTFQGEADIIEWEYGLQKNSLKPDQNNLKAGLRAMGITKCKVLKMVNYGSWLNG